MMRTNNMEIPFQIQEAPVSLSFKNAARGLVLIGLMLLIGIPTAWAQTALATLEAPPSGVAPAGDVLHPGHLGRQIAEVESIMHFYHDLIGL